MLAAHKGYTRTHQVIADVRQFGGGLAVGAPPGRGQHHHQQEPDPGRRAQDWDRPGGLRIGTTEVTRWGMREPEMARIADLIADVLHGSRAPGDVQAGRDRLRRSFPTLQYCFPLDGAT